MMRLLITGITGLLGSAVARHARKEYDVFGISRRTVPDLPAEGHDCIDLTDESATRRHLNRLRPEVIVHCAALTDVERCEANPELARAVNIEATQRLACWSEQHQASFVLISTDSVFDGTAGNYTEDDAPRPLNEYARTKLAAEKTIELSCPGSLILRTNFFGWSRQAKPSLAEWMLRKLCGGELLRAFVDVRFSPLFVNDLASVVLELVSRRATGTFHLGASDACSKYEFALLLAKTFSLPAQHVSPISLRDFPFAAPRPKDTSLAVSKVTIFLGREMPTVAKSMKEFRNSLRIEEPQRSFLEAAATR